MHRAANTHNPRRDHARLELLRLEDRLAPSWGVTPPAAVAVPTSFTAVTLNSSGDAAGTAAITANETDWFRFSARAGSHALRATTPTSNLDTVLGLYNSAGTRVAFNDDIASNNNDSAVTVSLAAGTYFLGVTNYVGTAGGGYSWSIDGPAAAPPPPADDAYENNDTLATSSNLGTLSAARTVTGLRMADAADFFRFTTAASGNNGSVAINFTHSQGDLDLQLFNAAGTQVRVSEGTANGESVSLAGLAAGTYTARVYGYNGVANPNYSLTLTPPTATTPPPPTTGGFAIQLRVSGMTASQQTIFQQAAARWAQVITGDLPNATYNGVAVDDLLIDASARNIDGRGGVLGQAGPDSFRSGSSLPIHGSMQFDTADLAALEASGGLFYTILHEMGHVLGVGTIWQTLGLVSGLGTSDPRFTGPRATAEYNAIFGRSERSVPVEATGGSGTAGSHFRDTTFGNELMTGFLNPGVNPLSRVTAASMADLGYVVNMGAADSFTRPVGQLQAAGSTGGTGGTGTGTGQLQGCGCSMCGSVVETRAAAADAVAPPPERAVSLAPQFTAPTPGHRPGVAGRPAEVLVALSQPRETPAAAARAEAAAADDVALHGVFVDTFAGA